MLSSSFLLAVTVLCSTFGLNVRIDQESIYFVQDEKDAVRRKEAIVSRRRLQRGDGEENKSESTNARSRIGGQDLRALSRKRRELLSIAFPPPPPPTFGFPGSREEETFISPREVEQGEYFSVYHTGTGPYYFCASREKLPPSSSSSSSSDFFQE